MLGAIFSFYPVVVLVMAPALHGPKLTSLMLYNPTYGPREGQEHLKVLYYYPESENSDVKVNNVGLCEALVQFTKTYSPEQPCESLHTQKHRQVFYEAETDFWFVMTVSNPLKETSRDGQQPLREYYEEMLKDVVLRAVLKRAYFMFKLFMGTLRQIVENEGVDGLKKKLKVFYTKYILDINIERSDILDVHNGIEYFPADKSFFLKFQSFINHTEASFPQIKHMVVLFGDKLLWSGLGKEDSRTLYSYLVNKLLPTSLEFESSTISSYLTREGSYGRFLAGVRYYEHSTDRHTTTVFVKSQREDVLQRLFMITYQVLNITVCLVLDGVSSPSVDTFRQLDAAMGKTLIGFSTAMDGVPTSSFDGSETQFKYVYFNKDSLSLRSSCHARDNSGFVRCSMPADVMRVVLNICQDFSKKNDDMEMITKANSDYWVVGKKTEQHECYIVVNQKNANLIEVNEEVKKICANNLNCISLYE